MSEYKGVPVITMRKPLEVDSAKIIVTCRFESLSVLVGVKHKQDDVIFIRPLKSTVVGFVSSNTTFLTFFDKKDPPKSAENLCALIKKVKGCGVIEGVVADEKQMWHVNTSKVTKMNNGFMVGDSTKTVQEAIENKVSLDAFIEQVIEILASEKQATYFDVAYIEKPDKNAEVFKYPAERIAYIVNRVSIAASTASLPSLVPRSPSLPPPAKTAVIKSPHRAADRVALPEEANPAPVKPPRRCTPLKVTKDEVRLFDELGQVVKLHEGLPLTYEAVGTIKILYHKKDDVHHIVAIDDASAELRVNVGLHKEDKPTCKLHSSSRDCVVVKGIHKRQGEDLVLRFSTDELSSRFIDAFKRVVS
uniref:IMC sub-compartment protein ISP1 n=1 Tax=Panagrellus redivivus TaxID=6233 RepID=A0A7E4W064_PANRE